MHIKIISFFVRYFKPVFTENFLISNVLLSASEMIFTFLHWTHTQVIYTNIGRTKINITYVCSVSNITANSIYKKCFASYDSSI